MDKLTTSIKTLFFANISRLELENSKGCWNWQGQPGAGGYGSIYYKGKAHGAHRVSWQIHNGEIPSGLFVCHRCDNPSCVNPNHLFLGTALDNNRDCINKGRRGYSKVGLRKNNGRKILKSSQ